MAAPILPESLDHTAVAGHLNELRTEAGETTQTLAAMSTALAELRMEKNQLEARLNSIEGPAAAAASAAAAAAAAALAKLQEQKDELEARLKAVEESWSGWDWYWSGNGGSEKRQYPSRG